VSGRLDGRPGLRTEPATTNALARELGQIAKRNGLRGCVLISFTSDRVGVNSSGEPADFARHMEQLGDRLLAAIDDGGFNPEVAAGERCGTKLITRAEYRKLAPRQQGYVAYMQGSLPGSELKKEVNPYRRGTAEYRDWSVGQDAACIEAQEGDD